MNDTGAAAPPPPEAGQPAPSDDPVTADALVAAPAPAPAAADDPSATRPGWHRRCASALRARWLLRPETGAASLLRNLGAGFAVVWPIRRRPRGELAVIGSPAQLIWLLLADLAIGIAFDLYEVGWQGGRLDLTALPAASFRSAAVLVMAWLLARAAGQTSRTLVFATLAASVLWWERVAAYALAIAADWDGVIDQFYPTLSWIPLLWCGLALGRALPAVLPVPGRWRAAALATACLGLVLVPQSVTNPAARLWMPVSSFDRDDAGPDAPESEPNFYAQMDLLGDALDAIEDGESGVTELFSIAFGGDGEQDVFLSEANGADAVIAEAFGSAGHSVVLANSVARPQERAFATLSSLQRTLEAMADRMEVNDDILVLTLSSHGTPDHHLVVSMPPYGFDDVTPERLRALLDESGIRYRVIIVSSCFAGGFIDPLANDDTLVIAASAADRSSFGCRDGAAWTDFGKAYFPDALAKSGSFEDAFDVARKRVAEQEKAQGLTPSLPQMRVGRGIHEQLKHLETRHGGHILFAHGMGRRLIAHARAAAYALRAPRRHRTPFIQKHLNQRATSWQ